MLAILYLLLCAAFGMCFVGLSVPDVRRLYVACSPSAKAITHIPNTLFTVPAGIVTGIVMLFPGCRETLVKAIVDTVLFLISYSIQQKFVFSSKSKNNP